ncbi:MAG: PASTA domain-containing protein [Candidatus Cloacimonetes bacterium]|jgi:serine/threonine-protein kinase|nr:PASTA domain-containing protein [Candidatus Cloacimonadota bacterium]MCB5286909.1 PASTA domain-containing protein [Candidatus Cloacimonadota bacterium]MCK9185197.1 PASTA domain-containing protein [Candidatus Cloacimonadota bacterium]MCK9584377.1 PASTA domain-containing protein [Candidatus Cloacimonadota bacterium]MDY0229230.1 PASTA domain-containing protein [Candidatus Cloacimonadaceae bacterium]
MSKTELRKWGYMLGIGLGIIFVTAFIFSQAILPLAIGRPKKVDTPNVVGLTVALAKRELAEHKLHVVVKDSLYNEAFKADQILDQSPVPGTRIKQEGTVFLVISKGSKMVTVPDLRGSRFQQAMVMLRNYDLRSSIVDSLYSDDYAQNEVIRSQPSPGTKLEKNSMIRLTLSRGPETRADSLDYDDYPYFD